MSRVTVGAVVLAAGGGSRFVGPEHKLLTAFGERPLVVWAVEAAHAAGLDETVVVWGAVDLAGLDLPDGITLLHNPRWAEGLATSLEVALTHAGCRDWEAVVVGLGDQPLVPAAAWRAVAATPAPVVVATYGGHRGHPVRLARSVWPYLPTTGDAGARSLLVDPNRPVREVAIACQEAGPEPPADIDTVEDLGRCGP